MCFSIPVLYFSIVNALDGRVGPLDAKMHFVWMAPKGQSILHFLRVREGQRTVRVTQISSSE